MTTPQPLPPRNRAWPICLVALAVLGPSARGAEGDSAAGRFRDEILPVLVDHCYACHADGVKKGGVAFDGYPSDEALVGDRKLWWNVLKNVRSGVMPPAKKPRPPADDVGRLERWVKRDALGIDPENPDPGRVTIRRLNRVEYRNTVRDLTGVDFRTDEEFPPDDSGYGFDNIGDVLTVSPLLLEKYMEAAETIVAAAVPAVSRAVASTTLNGSDFRGTDAEKDARGDRLSFYKPARVAHDFRAGKAGTYRLVVNLQVLGSFDFDPGRCRVTVGADGRELKREEFGWENGKKHKYELTQTWEAGAHPISIALEPLTPAEEKQNALDLKIGSVVVEGPLEPELWDRPKNFDRFFTQDAPAPGPERLAYARDVLGRFATRAYRRPVEPKIVDRLVAIAEEAYGQPGKTFEQGIAQALVAVLASPRFLFRVETTEPADAGKPFGLVDEYALASRLSYFLWSTTPDDELFKLAGRGEVRKNLKAQVDRLLADPRSEAMVENFTGQWLQARDVEGVSLDARSVLARDSGDEKDYKRQVEEFRAFLAQREAQKDRTPKESQGQRRARLSDRFPLVFGKAKVEMDGPLRVAMRRETEMFFSAVVHEDRSVLELLDSDFTFLNERLAGHYGITGVKGERMRRVSLPEGSPRGGLLTQGTVLVVTSNPTRTSPVKRGLFLLDNFLGTPPPPPPPDVPVLEDAEKAFKDREPTLRETLEIHRDKPLCNSCHSRMDPLGLALENFNALGQWRDAERRQPLDTAGRLVTGETFSGVRDLKRLLRGEHRTDFYRCLTEKLMTYALGRGLDAADVDAVDRVVDRLEASHGRFSALLTSVIESAPFQKRRNGSAADAPAGRPAPRIEANREP